MVFNQRQIVVMGVQPVVKGQAKAIERQFKILPPDIMNHQGFHVRANAWIRSKTISRMTGN